MTEKIERWEAKVKTDLAVVILKNLDNEIFTETVDQVFDFILQTLQKQAEFLDKSHSTWKYPSDIEAIYDYISTHFISKDEHKKILNSGHAMFEAGQRQVKEELREKIKNKLELHTHNSIPSYTASADE